MIVVPLPAPPFHYDIPLFIWSITGAITVSYSVNVSPVWVTFPFCSGKKKGNRKKRMPLSHNTAVPCVLKLFLLLLEILQLPSQLRSWFRGPVCKVSPHLECLLMTRCMSQQRIKRTLSRSDWNWNHFITRHYGKCCACEGAINIVKREPSAVGTYNTCVCYFKGQDLLRTCFFFAALFKCCLIHDQPPSEVMSSSLLTLDATMSPHAQTC